MRYLLAFIFVFQTTLLFGQQPPPYPGPLNLNLPETPIRPAPLPSAPAPNMIQTMGGMQNRTFRPGDTTRVKNSTVIYSAPHANAYPCNPINAGEKVTVLQLPEPGSSFTAIACPDNCYSLIPYEYLYTGLFNKNPPKNYKTERHRVQGTIVPLIDGEPADGKYLDSKITLRSGSMVTVRDEKVILFKGKQRKYCVILSDNKDVRYVRTADLEGIPDQALQQPQPNTFPNSPLYQNNPPRGSSPNDIYIPGQSSPPSAYPAEELPARWVSLVQAADQAYQYGLQTGVWEDARQRYMQLIDADVSSVRILAKNRLEFIREWQQSPPVKTVARTAEANYPPPYTQPWMPSEMAYRLPRQPAMTASQPLYVPETPIRPTTPTAMTQNGRPNSPLDIPLPPGQAVTPPVTTVTPQPISSAQPAPTNTPVQPQPTNPTAIPQSQKVTVVGKLNRSPVYSGSNPLFYLTKSDGYLSYYVRGINLQRFDQQRVKIEGLLYQAPIDGKLQSVITVEKVELLR